MVFTCTLAKIKDNKSSEITHLKEKCTVGRKLILEKDVISVLLFITHVILYVLGDLRFSFITDTMRRLD